MLEASDMGEIKSELRTGERILWSGKPEMPPRTAGHTFQFVFSCIWTLVVVLIFLPAGLVAVFGGDSGAFGFVFILFVGGFIAFGVWQVIRSFHAYKSPQFDLYALTDQRGMIVNTYQNKHVTALSPSDLLSSDRSIKRGDIGSLAFGPAVSSIFQLQASTFGDKVQKSFKNIRDPKKLEDLIYATFGQGKHHE